MNRQHTTLEDLMDNAKTCFKKAVEVLPFFVTTNRIIISQGEAPYPTDPVKPCALIYINGVDLRGLLLFNAEREKPCHVDPANVAQAPQEYFDYYSAVLELMLFKNSL